MGYSDDQLVQQVIQFLASSPNTEMPINSIVRAVNDVDKSIINRVLYSMQARGIVRKCQNQSPPTWMLLDTGQTRLHGSQDRARALSSRQPGTGMSFAGVVADQHALPPGCQQFDLRQNDMSAATSFVAGDVHHTCQPTATPGVSFVVKANEERIIADSSSNAPFAEKSCREALPSGKQDLVAKLHRLCLLLHKLLYLIINSSLKCLSIAKQVTNSGLTHLLQTLVMHLQATLLCKAVRQTLMCLKRLTLSVINLEMKLVLFLL
jgi:hypothetical protein